MTPDLPLNAATAAVPNDPHSNVRTIAHARSLSPPRPELPNKWRQKRQQVWSVARLRPELAPEQTESPDDLGTGTETAGVTETWTTSASPTERSVGHALRAALGDEQHAGQTLKSSRLIRVLSRPLDVRLVRVVMWGGLEVSRGAGALLVPVGMFVAGVGLVAASGLQLLVILPALVLRRSLLQFARFTIRQSGALQRRTHPDIGELAEARR